MGFLIKTLIFLLTLSSCSKVHEPTFDPLPHLSLSISVPILVYSEDVGTLSLAVSLWNSDCYLLAITDIESEADIVVRTGVSNERSGSVWRSSNGIVIIYVNSSMQKYLVLAHMLGRVLGLALDEDRRSIMSGIIYVDFYRHAVFPLPMPSYADRKALEERYCQ